MADERERRGHLLRNLALSSVAMLTLGSCGGMLLGHYTVTGMAPLGGASAPAHASYAPDPAAETGDGWFDVGAEVREAERGAEEITALASS